MTDLFDGWEPPRSGIAIPVQAITHLLKQGGTWEELLATIDQWVADVDSGDSPAIRWELPGNVETGDHLAESSGYCDAETHHGSERFGCLERPGHPPPHRGGSVPPPCGGCGGWERHSLEDCTDIDIDLDEQSNFEVVWEDGGVARLEPLP